MREMVLNHASVQISDQRRDALSAWLKDIVPSMGQLVRDRVVGMSLRMSHEPYVIECFGDYTLGHVFEELRGLGHRDEYVFLRRLVSRAPLLAGVDADIVDRFAATESVCVSSTDEEPLILCAITDWIIVSAPSKPLWDCDRLRVQFRERLSDGSIDESSEHVDQLSRSVHVKHILDRYVAKVRLGCNDPVILWENRQDAFPFLLFGPEVERNLASCAHLLHTIVGKLIELNEASEEWRNHGGPAPNWRTHVTPESKGRMSNAKFIKTRTFQSSLGGTKVFAWHARFGSGRIHLRFDAASRAVEIGYIGPHLPL